MSDLTKARTRLLLDNPFFGTLCLRLTPVEWEDQTGATDGKHLYYNKKWYNSLTFAQQTGFVAHEVMHVVLLHITRRGDRHPKKWNVACDYAINNFLISEGFILPDGGLVDSQYDDMTAEQIYDLLPEPPGGWDTIAIDFGGCGGVLDHPGKDGTKGTMDNLETEINVAINQAAEGAKMAGKLSGGLQTLVDKVVQPKVCWKAVLSRFLRGDSKSDFSWLRPNRRFIAGGLYLPSLHTPALEEITVAVDTSGSINDNELAQFTAETSSILRELAPEKINFLQCDWEVNEATTYTPDDLPLKITYQGRGGTAFEPVMSYVNKNYPLTKAVVYLTDLESNDFGAKPPYPVLWISTNKNMEVPYGEIVEM